MNLNLKKPILTFINSLLTLKGWQDISQPIIFQGEFSGKSKNLIDYFDDTSLLQKNMQNKNYTLLLETLLSYDSAIEDDWLPDSIEGLPIPKAYLFLNEIKNILEKNILDKKIETELIKKYHLINDSNDLE